jgi:hypothetical protein
MLFLNSIFKGGFGTVFSQKTDGKGGKGAGETGGDGSNGGGSGSGGGGSVDNSESGSSEYAVALGKHKRHAKALALFHFCLKAYLEALGKVSSFVIHVASDGRAWR